MKETICTAFGLVGSFLAALFGGWDSAFATLLIFIGVDYVTGLMVATAGSIEKCSGIAVKEREVKKNVRLDAGRK